ncbi:MAG TPA: 16S rRNA (adenine(1518)-N(6)/adenine(1519)-N(6))-dimethyltransferase RsmA [Rhizomicrobium sp.]|nr:16S rRNA (adenine(1518)-N(6)/adenine(1519)-N(6))-dimethyltransferase RsmA [Rhizomicrobium sp.]
MGDGLPPLREVIAAHGLAPKRSLGQNFLFDLNLTRRIARSAGPLDGQTVFEVGPGPGGLTRALLAEGAAHVIAVERDHRCIAALEEIAQAYPGRLTIIEDDALALDEAALFDGPVRVAANLPYNVGTAVLVKWLTAPVWPPFWSSLTLMFQREVALRLIAKPGTEHYGRLSVLTQWRATAKIQFDVSRGAFVPPPKVTSSIVRIEPLAEPVAQARLADLEKITAAAFGQRRKMLRQSLKVLSVDAEALIAEAGIDPTARAETLTVAEFAGLARVFFAGG